MNLDFNQKPSGYYNSDRKEMIPFIPSTAARILDVGCGDGNFAAAVKATRGIEVWGAESSLEAQNQARSKVDRLIAGDVAERLSELPDGYFDAIVFNDVIEHIYDPYTLLISMKKKLSPAGVVVCSIPNIRFFRVFFKFLFENKWEYTDDGILDKTHIRFFTFRSIRDSFVSLGYTIKTIKGIDKTKSLRPVIFNLLTLGRFPDIYYLRIVAVASPTA